jgi:hypothetical protein
MSFKLVAAILPASPYLTGVPKDFGVRRIGKSLSKLFDGPIGALFLFLVHFHFLLAAAKARAITSIASISDMLDVRDAMTLRRAWSSLRMPVST